MKNECVLIKKKEYDDLVKLSESKKPDEIKIYIYGVWNHVTREYEGISSTISLSDGIIKQIHSIRSAIWQKHRQHIDAYEKELHRINNMSTYEKLKWALCKK